MWEYDGSRRPSFAAKPSTTQESVWDYPRPPALQQESRTISIYDGNQLIAKSTQCYRVLETASPPTVYIPIDESMQMIAWSYPSPTEVFIPIKNYMAFYPGRINCFINDEKVKPQDGGFYGGWVSDEIVGPWKGSEGSGHW